MAAYKDESVLVENTRILFRNFRGLPDTFDVRGGVRKFSAVIPTDLALQMENDGWNIKWLEPREDGDKRVAHLPVKVNFDGARPPRVVMITSKGRNTLGVDEVGLLDFANIDFVDLIVNPFHWSVNGETGTKAYLKSMFVTIEEDYLDLKYADLEDSSDDPEEI